LSVTGTHPNRTLLDVSGSVSDIEQALHVHFQFYQHPTEDRTFHAPDVEPTLDLAIPILHISGLSDLSRPRSRPPGMAWGIAGLRPASGGSSPGGGFMGDDFRDAYVPGVTLTGAGQSVALVEFDGYFPSDIADYETLTGRTNVPLQNVLLDGADGSAGSDNSEVALDIEMAISMAPGLFQVIVYEAPNNIAYVNDILNRIATDNLARQISCSWFSYSDFGDRTNTEQVFQQYAAQGQSSLCLRNSERLSESL
jgi:subtilase family serine protease